MAVVSDGTLSVESLFGGQIAPEEAVLAGMRAVEANLADELSLAQEWRRAATAAVSDVVRAALVEVIGRDQLASVVEGVRARAASSRDHELVPAEIAGDIRRVFVS
jgi:hypothetical protein